MPEESEDEPTTFRDRAEGWFKTMERLRENEKMSRHKAAGQIAASAGVETTTVERETRRVRREQDEAGAKSGEKSGEII